MLRKKNRSIQLNLKKQIKKDYLDQTLFNKKVITNIGKYVIYYPPQQAFFTQLQISQNFYKNYIKLSYSYMPNIKFIIKK